MVLIGHRDAAISKIFETCRSTLNFELNVTPRTVRKLNLLRKVADEVGGVRRLIKKFDTVLFPA